MATTPEEANKDFQEFKTLQQEWKNIKPVPSERLMNCGVTISSTLNSIMIY